jgi:GNAT superfamily N-acetyltransferase
MPNPPCPFLPVVDRVHSAADVNRFPKSDRGPGFYVACLRYAQSLWQSGLPAQAILQCNRALAIPLPGEEPVLRQWPLPYQALAWILLNRQEGQFIGNPRRHWQHLASRMVEPHKELRIWRAWACWYLAKTVLPESEFPADMKQIRGERLVEPTFDSIFNHLARLSPAEDLATWQHALNWAKDQVPSVPDRDPAGEVRIRVIQPAELPVVIGLARRIWNAYYPGIITQGQIDYMLAVWYDPGAMTREMTGRGVTYALIESDGAAVGYLGFEPQPDSRVLFLSKLYLLPEQHGKGIGRFALDWVRRQAGDRGHEVLRLRVNKHNAPAIRAYLRAGFLFIEDICSDIGNGFVMDDYLMERAV